MTESISLLVDAKREYVTRLAEVIAPSALRFIDDSYSLIKKTSSANKTLLNFQNVLREVPKWNSDTIKNMTNAIVARTPYMDQLIAAVFVSYVKVLSSIKLSTSKPNIRLKLPANEAFIHQVYISLAKELYENPEIARSADHQARFTIVTSSIEAAVREMLPFADILSAYLGNSIDDNHTMNPVLSPAQSDEDTDDDDGYEDQNDTAPPAAPANAEKIIQFDNTVAEPISYPFAAPPPAAAPTMQPPPAAAPTMQPAPVAAPTMQPAPVAAQHLFPDADDDEKRFA